jgi:hypothetical protein
VNIKFGDSHFAQNLKHSKKGETRPLSLFFSNIYKHKKRERGMYESLYLKEQLCKIHNAHALSAACPGEECILERVNCMGYIEQFVYITLKRPILKRDCTRTVWPNKDQKKQTLTVPR